MDFKHPRKFLTVSNYQVSPFLHTAIPFHLVVTKEGYYHLPSILCVFKPHFRVKQSVDPGHPRGKSSRIVKYFILKSQGLISLLRFRLQFGFDSPKVTVLTVKMCLCARLCDH